MNCIFEDIDFKIGEIVWDSSYDYNKSNEEQLLWLGEDLFNVIFCCENLCYTIDVGWYPESSPEGSFRIIIIKNIDWDVHLYYKRTRDYGKLHKYMEECMEIVMRLMKKDDK